MHVKASIEQHSGIAVGKAQPAGEGEPQYQDEQMLNSQRTWTEIDGPRQVWDMKNCHLTGGKKICIIPQLSVSIISEEESLNRKSSHAPSRRFSTIK